MERDTVPVNYLLALALTTCGILLVLSMVSYLIAVNSVVTEISLIARPGGFFWQAFSWLGFGVPAYAFLFAWFLVSPQWYKKGVLILTLSTLPYLTLSMGCKIASETPPLSTVVAVFRESLGTIPSLTLLGLLLAAELYSCCLLYQRIVLSRFFLSVDPATDTNQTALSLRQIQAATSAELAEWDREYEAKESTQSLDTNFAPAGPSKDLMAVLYKDQTGHELSAPTIEDAEYELLEQEEAAVVQKHTITPAAYTVPINILLKDYKDGQYHEVDNQTRNSGGILMNTLMEFNIAAELTGIRKGPVVTMFEILPSPGVKLSRIVNLGDNIALRLAAQSVRIVAPIPGKQAVGIEVPNKDRAIVSLKEIISSACFIDSKYEIPVVLGKNIAGEAQIIDLCQTPHLLIAGATGSGKSVCVNSLITSILYKKSPQEVKLLLIDPKIVELKIYNDIPHLLTPVITEAKRSFQALQYCVYEMERRYSLLDSLGVRDISSFNSKIKTKKLAVETMPYIVIVIDEFADLMAITGKELEAIIARLASMSRAVGIHLVLATQRPSVDVITGLIKANIPARIAFMVASKFDSRIIIDSVGAEKLLGKGDMLFSSAWNPTPLRIQGAFLSEEEVESVTAYLKEVGEPDYIDDEIFIGDEDEELVFSGADDPLLDKALEIVINSKRASTSYIQRKLKIGYNRAARLIENMEHRGIIGPPNGSKPREILHVPDFKTQAGS